MIFSFNIDCDDSGGGDVDGTETAWAYGCDDATCFSTIDEDGDGTPDFTKWGWTNGPLSEVGIYYFDIYAAAGQCDLTKGTLVGELIVDFDGTQALVEFTTCGSYYLDETHLYVGNEILPRDVNGEYTVAPGQFDYKHENLPQGTQSDFYAPIAVTAPFYVVAHAVVGGDYTSGDCGTPGCEPPCTKYGAAWADFSIELPTGNYYSSPKTITLCDGKTVTIDIEKFSTPEIQFDGQTVTKPFFLDEYSVFDNVDEIDYMRFRTRAASAVGNFNNAAPNSYTMTWTFPTPLDATNFFVVGQLLQGNVATITAYATDMTTVVNTDLAFEQLAAEKSTFTFHEPLSWTASTGVLKKNTTTGSNSKYGFFSIPDGTEIGKIVIALVDDGSRGSTADEVNYGIGCRVCIQ
jgi:hypothetical protein